MPRVIFGRYEFDAERGELSREGVPVRLQPQPARVLALLTARAGELVTRDELRQRVWGDDTFVDFERGLNFCIAQIRSALKDSADSPRFVETVPKRGYRFIAPVRPAGAADGPAATLPRETAGPERGAFGAAPRRALIAGALVLTLAALAAAAVWVARARPFTMAGRPIPIAVAAFDNETGSSEFDQVASGLADATVAQLVSADASGALRVIGSAAILRRARRFRDVKTIGAELAVDYVVLGQVQRDADHVRLVAHLIRVSDESHLWASRFDRPSFSLDVQAELAEAIARAIITHLQTPPPPAAPSSQAPGTP